MNLPKFTKNDLRILRAYCQGKRKAEDIQKYTRMHISLVYENIKKLRLQGYLHDEQFLRVMADYLEVEYIPAEEDEPLSQSIIEFLKALAFSIEAADEKGIPRSQIDITTLLKICRNEEFEFQVKEAKS